MVAALVASAALACTARPGTGQVAYASAGALEVLDLGTCRTRTLVRHGAEAPVAFSRDGEWIAFGNGSVVSAQGGSVLHPIGSVYRWAWSPSQDVLAGLTTQEGVVQGGPGMKEQVRAPAGWGANSVAWSPDGRSLAVGRGKFHGPATASGIQQLVVFDPAGRMKVVYRTPHGQVAPPFVAAWISTQIFFQPDPQNSASIAADGLPLVAVNPDSGQKASVVNAMLPLPGFIAACGAQAAIVAGGDRNTQTNKRIIRYDGTRVAPVVSGGGQAWLEPACSANGQALAVAAGPDRPAPGLIQPQRSIWLVTFDGREKRQLTHSPKGWSDEAPAWTRDGKTVVFVRERLDRGSLYVVRVSDRRLIGPLAADVSGFAVSP